MTANIFTYEQTEEAIERATQADGIIDFACIADYAVSSGNVVRTYWIWLKEIDLQALPNQMPGSNTRAEISKLYEDGVVYTSSNHIKPPATEGGEMQEHVKTHPLRTQNHCVQCILQPKSGKGTQINLIFSHPQAYSGVVCTNDEHPDWMTKFVQI